MIKSEEILRWMRENDTRSNRISVDQERVRLVIFTLNRTCYAFFGKQIREILPYEPIFYVPGCPTVIRGVINVRGDIESIVNIHELLSIREPEITKNTRIVIASDRKIRSGILVESVEDVIEIPQSAIKRPISTLEHPIRDFAAGGEMIFNGQYVTILDVGKIFERIRI